MDSIIHVLVESTNKYGVRSSKRADEVHACIAEYITHRNHGLSCRVEYKLPTALGDFDVDIAVFRGQVLVACVLFKGLNSSITKNAKNYEHNKLGEAIKAKSGMPDTAKLVYLDVIPIRCPTYGSGNIIKCWESHSPPLVRDHAQRLCNVANKGRAYPIIDDVYTIFVEYTYHEDRRFELVSVVDDSDVPRFDTFIDSLVAHEG